MVDHLQPFPLAPELLQPLEEATRQVIQTLLFRQRSVLHPRRVPVLTQEILHRLEGFFQQPDEAQAEAHGRWLYQQGLTEETLLAVTRAQRRIFVERLTSADVLHALDLFDRWAHWALLAFQKEAQRTLLQEQEDLRRAAMRTIQAQQQRLELAAEIAHIITAYTDEETLLRESVEILRERLGLYYVGIFLLDEFGQWAILRAGSGEAGRRMIQDGYKLKVDEHSMIGWAILHRKPRVAQDVGLDAVRFANPYLPDTHSEMALPLQVGETIIGAMTIQSERVAAFGDEDVRVLRIVANQLATAIQNARRFVILQRESQSLRRGLQDQVRQAWSAMVPRAFEYILNQDTIRPLDPQPLRPEAQQALAARQPVVVNRAEGASQTALAVPILLQEEPIGVVDLYDPQIPLFDEEAQRIAQVVAEQMALALENRRLFEEAQRRAQELQTAAEIARDTSALQSLEELLSKAVNLIRERFGFYHASVFLLDEQGEYAVVQESTGKAGEEMKRRGHKLRVGSRSVVGQATGTGRAVVVNDTLHSDIHRPNPLLPDTRAELAIPLKIGERIIGALDVQSTRPNAFSPDDVQVLQILADQLAVAVENARAYELSQRAVEELRRADQLKSQFLANMSHELRTPLNSIIGFSKVILKGIDGPITDLQRQDLTAIHNAGQHLLGLINDILDLSKIEAGKMQLSYEEVSMADLINSVMSTAVGLVKDKPIQLIKEIEPDLPTVRADPMRIRQVILNLVSNAAKFTEEGHIRVFARRQKGPHGLEEILIGVEDTGPGIAPEDQDKLFKPFSQVDASPTRKTGGTGLGLSISRSLVEMHGGRIWLESEVGKGSTFYFTLPLIPPQAQDKEEEHIVIAVDDDPNVIHLYQRYLTPHGYRVIPVTDPDQVLARVLELKPLAVLLDILMPERDGWSVLQELKQHPQTRTVPVILCTILEDQERGFSLGATAYLTKPIYQEDLLKVLRQLDPDQRTQTLLVVDDDENDRTLIRKLLREAGEFTIRESSNGAEALEQLRNSPPDAVILDLLMPEVDGFHLLEAIRSDARLKDLPVIVYTAADLDPGEQAYLQQAAQALLRKHQTPIQELITTLQTLLQRYATAQQGP